MTQYTRYSRIENSATIRHISDGQREGLHKIKLFFFYIWNAFLTYIQLLNMS